MVIYAHSSVREFRWLNAWLAVRCEELAGRRHPEQTGRTIADCFIEEKPLLIPVKAIFDGYVEKTLRVSSTCLIKVDHNRYSVLAEWANRVVSLRITAGRLRIVAENQIVAEHARCYGRDRLICDPWHYLPGQWLSDSCKSMLLFSMNWATCHSRNPVVLCCSISSASFMRKPL